MRIVDLSWPIHEGMPTYPVFWHTVVEITQLGRHGIEDRETRKLVMSTHTGTHCDAPRHFIPEGQTIDQVSLAQLVGAALVLDFSDVSDFQELSIPDFEHKLGPLCPERLVLRFDWSDNWGTMRYYMEHPYLSEDVAHWLVSRDLKLLAMDTPQIENPKNGRGAARDSPLHKIFLGKGIILVENLCNLREIQKPEIELYVLPLKIKDGDGAPARCIAIERN